MADHRFRYRAHDAFSAAFDPTRCAATVYDGRSPRAYQCHYKHAKGSDWCTRHSPEADAAREAKQRERYEREMSKLRAQFRRPVECFRDRLIVKLRAAGIEEATIKIVQEEPIEVE